MQKILYYAPGSGLGHITRAQAVVFSLAIDFRQVILVCSIDYLPDNLLFKEIVVLPKEMRKNPKALQDFLQEIIIQKQIKELFVDTFPCGIVGELNSLSLNTVIYYIARILKWKFYKENYIERLPEFEKIYLLEKIESQHLQDISQQGNLQNFILHYPKIPLNSTQKQILKQIKNKQFWLIVHSQPVSEVEIVINHALDIKAIEKSKAQIIVCSLEKIIIQNVEYLSVYPAGFLYPFAEKIFSACGFNSYFQLKEYREKHICLPFQRTYDNQFLRKSR